MNAAEMKIKNNKLVLFAIFSGLLYMYTNLFLRQEIEQVALPGLSPLCPGYSVLRSA